MLFFFLPINNVGINDNTNSNGVPHKPMILGKTLCNKNNTTKAIIGVITVQFNSFNTSKLTTSADSSWLIVAQYGFPNTTTAAEIATNTP